MALHYYIDLSQYKITCRTKEMPNYILQPAYTTHKS